MKIHLHCNIFLVFRIIIKSESTFFGSPLPVSIPLEHAILNKSKNVIKKHKVGKSPDY